ncbi:MAG: hypothetical protein IPM85_12230 [Chitinophagaceae bacterium]|nr:hypothetical protein [Chitinophagaceae bacterium]
MDNFTYTDDELLVRYIDGELDKEAQVKVEERLATDTVFNNSYEGLLISKEAVRQYGLKQKVSVIHKQMMQEQMAPVRQIGSGKKFLRYSLSIAATLVLLAGSLMLYNFFTLSADKVFNLKYQSYNLATARSNETKESHIVKAYREKNFLEVTKLFDAGTDKSNEAIFLAGIAALEVNNNAKAINNFRMVLAANQQLKQKLFNDEAEYYLALTYIRNADYDFALELLYKIRVDQNHSYNKSVTAKLLRQLKMLKWR